MAHVRRKFVDIHRSQGSPIAEEAIGRIAKLYAVEKEARGPPPDRRTELRRAHAAPAFDDLERWLDMQLTTISGKSPLAGAIRYALTRMERLRPYLDHGILELDNNAAERSMRAVALGRKNYLFVGSEAGGKAAAIAYTLIERPNSTPSIPTPGSPTPSPVSPNTRSPRSMTCFHGDGTDRGQAGRLLGSGPSCGSTGASCARFRSLWCGRDRSSSQRERRWRSKRFGVDLNRFISTMRFSLRFRMPQSGARASALWRKFNSSPLCLAPTHPFIQ